MSSFIPRLALPWRWPLPALVVWAAGWALFAALRGLNPALALAVGCAPGFVAAALWRSASGLRRGLLAAGFPLAVLASGVALPAWAWAVSLLPLLAIHPLRTWRDAPLFPTPAGALGGLPAQIKLPPAARLLDAGCGLGHGLAALHAAWPDARLDGTEWSWPVALAARWRCRSFARVRQGDMWRQAWSDHDLVYLFQRPESMARAWDKACREMRPGSWLVSLEFAVPDRTPDAAWRDGPKPVWLYRMAPDRAQSPAPVADIPCKQPALPRRLQHRG